jgi:hypothetical protein
MARSRAGHRSAATPVDAARPMVGLRLSALRLPLVAGGESIFRVALWWWHSSGAEARRENVRILSATAWRSRGGGPARRAVEGACGGAASCESDAPSTTPCAGWSSFPASRDRMITCRRASGKLSTRGGRGFAFALIGELVGISAGDLHDSACRRRHRRRGARQLRR